jgi:hypothetical protein
MKNAVDEIVQQVFSNGMADSQCAVIRHEMKIEVDSDK